MVARAQLTPIAETNEAGRHSPLPDSRRASAQMRDYLGHLCGIF
jgi:hypothetical protein